MQSLQDTTSLSESRDTCARDLLDVVPLVMRIIREQMRRHRSGLTVPQFRTLCFVSTTPVSSLSAVADFIGLSLPAMSRLVDGLVEQQLLERRPCSDDRRHIRLSVTPAGDDALAEARQMAQAHLADAMARLGPRQRQTIMQSMVLLRGVFSKEHIVGSGAEERALP